MSYCQICAVEADTRRVTFRQNIGALVLRFSSTLEADVCKSCAHSEFWKRTLITVAVGWLGVISLIVAPIFVLMNLVSYAGVANLPPPTSRGPDNDPAAIRRLKLAFPVHAQRLRSGESLPRVTNDLCRDAQCTEGQANAFLKMASGGSLRLR